MLYRKYLGIDLGTDNTRIYVKGKGVIVNQPSIVSFNNRTNRIVAVGTRAKEMLARTPSHITAMHPIENGVTADFDMAKEMIRMFMEHNGVPWSFLTEAIVTVPTNLTEVERKSAVDLFKEIGANHVHLLQQPLAAAFSNRLEVYEPSARLILDIGAGSTDMAVISMGGIVISRRIKIAGNRFNADIMRNVRDALHLEIGEPTAEKIKLSVGSARPKGNTHLEVAIRGRDAVSGLPREERVKDSSVREWIMPSLKKIIETMKTLVEATPAELVGDIYKDGCYLCGGGSLLFGLGGLIEREVGVKVQIMEEPMTSVVRGAGVVTEHFDAYRLALEGPAQAVEA